MIKRELAKDPKLANESWDRFLPKFRKRHEKKKKATTVETGANSIPVAASNGQPATSSVPIPIAEQKEKSQKKEKKVYTPFPPAQQPSKIDLQLESGEYFLKPQEKKEKAEQKRKEKEARVTAARAEERAAAFVAPEEPAARAAVGSAAASKEEHSSKEKKDKKKKKRKHAEEQEEDD